MKYLLYVYVPESHKEIVKDALFRAGAGDFGSYDRCSWETLGTGQFRPRSGADPFLGNVNQVHREPEYRIEFYCDGSKLESIEKALDQSHPYEVPAYGFLAIEP